MLVTPRLYQQFQKSDRELGRLDRIFSNSPWYEPDPETVRCARRMLLIHQAGTVRVGEIVR